MNCENSRFIFYLFFCYCRNLNNYSTETASEYENNRNNNNVTYFDETMPTIVKPKSARATPMRSRPTTPSKFVHSITHAPASSRPISRHSSQLSLRLHTRSKTDNNLKSYPTAFKVIPSPVVSAPPTPRMSRRKFKSKNGPDEYDKMETEWIKPPPEKLREVMSQTKMMSLPTSPIITSKIRIGSENR